MQIKLRVKLYSKGYSVIGTDDRITGALIIPQLIKGKPVFEIDKKAFEGQTGITTVTIPDSIIRIGDRAFQRCTGLKKIITSPRTKLDSIGGRAFFGCSSLDFVVPESVHFIADKAVEGIKSYKNPAQERFHNFERQRASDMKIVRGRGQKIDKPLPPKGDPFWDQPNPRIS